MIQDVMFSKFSGLTQVYKDSIHTTHQTFDVQFDQEQLIIKWKSSQIHSCSQSSSILLSQRNSILRSLETWYLRTTDSHRILLERICRDVHDFHTWHEMITKINRRTSVPFISISPALVLRMMSKS